MSPQLALPLKLQDHAVFESFRTSGNETLVGYLERLTGANSGSGCWLWGGPATGKTHLLQAVCNRFGEDSVYVPLARFAAAAPAILDGLASRCCVCLDDIDAAAGDERWEHALFELWNEIGDRSGILVVAAKAAPRDSRFVLPDLESRMARLPAFRIAPLEDADRIGALQLRAGHRGLDLPEDTARYLLTRSRRDMASLYALLDRLDGESLKAQRRLTIPFVRTVLAAPNTDGR